MLKFIDVYDEKKMIIFKTLGPFLEPSPLSNSDISSNVFTGGKSLKLLSRRQPAGV